MLLDRPCRLAPHAGEHDDAVAIVLWAIEIERMER